MDTTLLVMAKGQQTEGKEMIDRWFMDLAGFLKSEDVNL